jgi:hypothetical protein
MTQQAPGLLRNRAALLVALVVCIWAALPQSLRLTALYSITHLPPRPLPRPILIFGLVGSSFITASIAIRSSFLSDRVVVGAAAGASVLRLITSLISPNPGATLVVDRLVSLLWAIGAVASLVFLISPSRQRTG